MAYQIRITIEGIEPPIWRRLRVPGNMTFAQLHQVIQVSFGWLDYHLYLFRFGNTVITEPDPAFSDAELHGKEAERLDPADTPVSRLFENQSEGVYEYDFGDSWIHHIAVEKRLKDTSRNRFPTCLGGARHRPPEDVGGVWGYEEFLETIRGDGAFLGRRGAHRDAEARLVGAHRRGGRRYVYVGTHRRPAPPPGRWPHRDRHGQRWKAKGHEKPRGRTHKALKRIAMTA